jgi:hypothetical protein
MVVEGRPGLMPILLASKLLYVLPCARKAKKCKENGPDLLGVGQESGNKRSIGLEVLKFFVKISFVE